MASNETPSVPPSSPKTSPFKTDPALLSSAITTTSSQKVRRALQFVVENSPDAFDLACSQLLEPEVLSPGSRAAAAATNRKPIYTKKRFAKCVQCKEEYTVVDNEDGYCLWHDGDLEPNYDHFIWEDHDEAVDGAIDTSEMRKKFPYGFIWTCCEEEGDDWGCCEGRHRPKGKAYKKKEEVQSG